MLCLYGNDFIDSGGRRQNTLTLSAAHGSYLSPRAAEVKTNGDDGATISDVQSILYCSHKTDGNCARYLYIPTLYTILGGEGAAEREGLATITPTAFSTNKFTKWSHKYIWPVCILSNSTVVVVLTLQKDTEREIEIDRWRERERDIVCSNEHYICHSNFLSSSFIFMYHTHSKVRFSHSCIASSGLVRCFIRYKIMVCESWRF